MNKKPVADWRLIRSHSVPTGTYGQLHWNQPLYGSAVVVCEDPLEECGRFLVVEHRRDFDFHERIPLAEIAIEGCKVRRLHYSDAGF
jgi:hypothetical protein